MAARSPWRVAAIWMLMPQIAGLAGVQVGDGFPVPGRADRAVDQHGRGAGDLFRVGYAVSEGFPDQGPEQVPASARGGLADIEDGTGEVLGDVLAQQRDHHRDRAVQAERVGATVGVEVAVDGADAGGQLGELPIGQSCHSLIPQRLLRLFSLFW
jgi:hypothetical protein